MIKPKIPCDKHCSERKQGCHGSCQIYQDYANALNQYKEHIRQERKKERGEYIEWTKSRRERIMGKKH